MEDIDKLKVHSFFLRAGETDMPDSLWRHEVLYRVSVEIERRFPVHQFTFGFIDGFTRLEVYRKSSWIENRPPILVVKIGDDRLWSVQYSWQSPVTALWLNSCDGDIVSEIVEECELKLNVHLRGG